MTRYLARRLVQTIPILLLITIIQFMLIRASPGGPLKAYLENPMTTVEHIKIMERQLGLDQPLPIQYLTWMLGNDWTLVDADGDGVAETKGTTRGMLRGDFGYSYFTHLPALETILGRLPATIELGVAATLISYLIGIPLGVYAGLHRGGRIDHLVRFSTSLLNSVPHWWLGLIFIILIANLKLATGVQILPLGGRYTLGTEEFDLLDHLWHLILPAFLMGTGGWITFGRFMRSETLEVLGQDYVRTARAKGLGARVVTFRHILRNALIPVVTISGGLFVGIINGATLYELVFSWPGMGRLVLEATLKKDFPVSIGALAIFATVGVLGRLLADIAYGWVDPRIRYD